MKKYFITSCGTDIGKTLVTSSLCYQLRQKEKNVHALKPVISGWKNEPEIDTFQILASLNLDPTRENIEKVSFYKFLQPLSPDMAAKNEGKEIDFDQLQRFCLSFNDHEYLFIEGIGGAMVPLNDNKTTLDLIQQLNFPAIIVVGSYLGAISHTLSTIENLYNKNVKISSVIVSESEDSSVDLDQTISTLENFIDETIIKLPRIKTPNNDSLKKWQYTPNLLEGLS